jgi:hypothetical protein
MILVKARTEAFGLKSTACYRVRLSPGVTKQRGSINSAQAFVFGRSRLRARAGIGTAQALKHDPEKRAAVFRKGHAQTKAKARR